MLTKVEIFSQQPDAPTLPLGGFMPSDDPVFVRNIDGLGPVKADIQTSPLASGRGELSQGSSVGKRNIILTLGFNPDWDGLQTVASLRQILYRYLMPENWTKLRFFSQELPNVDIEGFVESLDPNMFSQDPELQCSIICPKPDFIETDATIYNGVVDDGTLEMEFEYAGTIDTGYELRVDFTADNVDYTGPITITHTAFAKEQMVEVDPVTIDGIRYFKMSSVAGAKRVQSVAKADGALTNLLEVMTGDWPVIKQGQNLLKVAATENGQAWTLAYFNRYGGI